MSKEKWESFKAFLLINLARDGIFIISNRFVVHFVCDYYNTTGFLPLVHNSMQKYYSFYDGWNQGGAENDWSQEIHQKYSAFSNYLRL